MGATTSVKRRADFVPVLLGGDANAYGMARSFHEEHGVASHAVCKGAFHICRNSKILSVDVTEPLLEDDDVFVRTLIDYARSRNAGASPLVLVPCGDNYTRMLVRNQDALRDFYRFCIMSPQTYELLSTKERFYSTCERFGLAFPATDEVDSSTAAGYAPPFPFPVMVKPSNSVAYWNCDFPGKKKAYAVRDQGELARVIERVFGAGYDDSLIVQDFVPGDDSRMRVVNAYSDRTGRVRMTCVGDVVLEEHTPLGIGSYAAIMTGDAPELALRVASFLEEVGYVGFSNFDFKLDERDGSFKLFEINPRQGRSSFFCTAAGKNLARYLVDDVVRGTESAEVPQAQARSVLWTMVPTSIVRRYVLDESVRSRALDLISSGRVVHSYWAPYDRSLARWASFRINQRNYEKQYARWFGRRHVDD